MIRLSISQEGGPPRLVTVDSSSITIGRISQADLCLAGKGVSTWHCRFTRTATGLTVEDLGSTNGTYVNRQRITAPVLVTPSDEVVMAVYQIRVVEAGAGATTAGSAVASPGQVGPAPIAATGQPRPAHPSAAGAAAQFTGQPVGPARTGGPSRAALLATGQVQALSRSPPASPSPSSPPQTESRDAEWAREWEKIDSLSRAWLSAGRDGKRLLRGKKLKSAKQWLAAGKGQSPAPKREQRDFVFASSRASALRTVRNVAIGGLALGAIGVGTWVAVTGLPGVDDEVNDGAESPVVAQADDPKAPAQDPDRGPAAADAAASAAAAALQSDATLATLLAIEGLSRLPDVQTYRASNSAKVFRAAVSKLRGQPLVGHTAAVTDAAFSADGRYAITSSADRSARVWDLSGEAKLPVFALRGHGQAVKALAVSPVGKHLFTGGDDAKIFRWDLEDPDPPTTAVLLDGHESGVSSLAISRDGRWLASGSADGTARVWDATAASPKGRALTGHTAPVRAVDINATGTRVAAASQDGTGSVWQVADGSPGRRTRLEGHEGELLDIALSADDRWVLTGSSDGTARLWNPSRRIPGLTALVLEGHAGPVSRVAITSDSTLAVTTGEDSTLRIWDLQSKNPELNAPTFDLHKGPVVDLVLDAPRGEGDKRPRLALSASDDGSARTWNLDRRAHEQDSVELAGHEGGARAAAFSPDGLLVVTGGADGRGRVWAHGSSLPGGASVAARGHTGPVTSVAVNPVGTRMVSGSADGTARVWDMTRPGRARQIGTLEGESGAVTVVAISPDGKFTATADMTGQIRLWDLMQPDPGAAHRTLRKHKRGVTQLRFTADGGRLVSMSTDAVYVWRLSADPEKDAVKLRHKDELVAMAVSEDGKSLMTASVKRLKLWDLSAADIASTSRGLKKMHELDIITVGVSPKGKWATSSAKDATLVLWDLEHGGKATPLYLHDKAVDAISFSRDGRYMATGSRDTTIRLWDLSSDRPQEGSIVLRGHEQRIGRLVFDEESTVLVSASNDKTLRVWDITASGEEAVNASVVVLSGHEGVVSDAAVSADVRFVVSSSYDRTARVWPLLPSDLIAIGCRKAGRSLTIEEWETVFKSPYKRRCN